MNANPLTLRFRNKILSTTAGCALLAVCSLFTGVATASADVRVGVSLGVELPHGYADVRVGRDHYYSHHGIFYRRGPRGYYVVHAPRGAILRVLPPYATRIYIGPTLYYRYDDVYYQPTRDGYVVVDAPAAPSLPPPRPMEVGQSVWVGSTEYVFKGGQFFTKTADGLVWVQPPLGAITKDLPPDVQSVWHEGTEYFESDEVYFRKTPDGYQVVTPPWKK